MHTGISWDGWHGLAAGALSTGSEQQLHISYDSNDSLDYLVCLEVLPWESFGWVPAGVVAEHLEWVLSTPLNAMPSVYSPRAFRVSNTAAQVIAEHVARVLSTPLNAVAPVCTARASCGR